MDKGKAYIGTSGWTYKEWNGTFYPADVKGTDQLIYYAQRYNTVEINATFYRWPQQKAVENWPGRVPENFRFAFKIWRGISEKKDIMDDVQVIDDFLTRMQPLKRKAAPLLLQLPPGRTVEALASLDGFLGHIRKRDWDLAVEFREQSWYCDKAYETLDRHGVTLVQHDMKGSANDFTNDRAPFLYRRYHGTGAGKYRGGYAGKKILDGHAQEFTSALDKGKNIYAYFNNDIGGDAIRDAEALKVLVKD